MDQSVGVESEVGGGDGQISLLQIEKLLADSAETCIARDPNQTINSKSQVSSNPSTVSGSILTRNSLSSIRVL